MTCVSNISAQLSGDYNIDQTASGSSLFSNGGKYFNSFTEVLNELWSQGVNGAVMVYVEGGQTFNENLQIDSTFTGASAINTIEFKYEGSNKPVLQPDQAGFGELVGVIDIRFDGDYYLTFNGLKINATNGDLTYRRGVRIIWGADHVTIKNCEIVDFDANGIAIYFGGGSGGANNGCENNVIEGNEIYHENLSSTAFVVAGIWINGGVDTEVRSNHVHDLLEGSGTLTGIYSSGSADTNNVSIYNNFVTIGNSITSDIKIYGIYTQHATGSAVNVYFNSIRLGGAVDNASEFTAAMRFTNSGATQVENNIISNFRVNNSGTGTHYSVYLATGSVTYTGDHNDLYTPQSPLAYRIGDVTDLASWQSKTGEDANSISADPLFVSSSDLHVQETSLTADAGVRIPGISVDIDGEPRDFFNPDMGADEFSGDISLPVELTSFKASVVNKKVVLEWVTESEINNHGFEVWKSEKENSNYSLLASYRDNPELEGQGNSPVKHRYDFIDQFVSSGQQYFYKLADVEISGVKTFHDPISISLNRSKMIDEQGESRGKLTEFSLHQNYPNPFNPSTVINYYLPISNFVELSIYNSLGQKVVTLVSESKEAGSHQVEWDASGFAGGLYYYRLITNNYQGVRKMLLVR